MALAQSARGRRQQAEHARRQRQAVDRLKQKRKNHWGVREGRAGGHRGIEGGGNVASARASSRA